VCAFSDAISTIVGENKKKSTPLSKQITSFFDPENAMEKRITRRIRRRRR
jgi:hypothetical protein